MRSHKRDGFSLLGLAVSMLIIVVLAGLVILAVTGFFTSARTSAYESDIHTVKAAVDAYITRTFQAPTASGRLPRSGEYALIDFDASAENGRKISFYPDLLSKLPKHHDEGVWRIDSSALVSVDMEPEEY